MINDKIHSSHSKERVIVTYSFPGGSHNQTNTTTNLCKNNFFHPEGTYGCVGNLKIYGWASNESLYIAENRRTYTVRFNQFFFIVILFFIFDLHYLLLLFFFNNTSTSIIICFIFFSINLLVFIPITASMATYIGIFLFNAVLVFIFNFNFTFTFTFIFIFISIIFISLLL